MASTTRRRFVDTLNRAAIYGRGLKGGLEAVRYAGPVRDHHGRAQIDNPLIPALELLRTNSSIASAAGRQTHAALS